MNYLNQVFTMIKNLTAALAALLAVSCMNEAPLELAPLAEQKSKAIIEVDGMKFRDLNGNGALHPYEDSRETEERITDLIGQMSIAEKAERCIPDRVSGTGDPMSTEEVEVLRRVC